MRRCRTSYDIKFKIAETIRKRKEEGLETRKTHIMYAAYLSPKQTNDYLEELIEDGIINKVSKKVNDREYFTYELSSQGDGFLDEGKPNFEILKRLITLAK